MPRLERAECRDPEIAPLFTPSGAAEPSARAEAREACARCLDRPACLEWAVHHEDSGIWAGLGRDGLRALRIERGIRLATLRAGWVPAPRAPRAGLAVRPSMPAAACLEPEHAAKFERAVGGSAHPAIAVCNRCWERPACLAWALEYENFGIWGGHTPRGLNRLRAAFGITVQQPARIHAWRPHEEHDHDESDD